MEPKAFLFTLYLCIGALLCLICLPLIFGMIGPNPWYGFRVKRTLDDPAVWYPANRFGGWLLMAVAVLLMVVATVGYVFLPRLGFVAYALTCLAAVVVGLAVALVPLLRYLRKL